MQFLHDSDEVTKQAKFHTVFNRASVTVNETERTLANNQVTEQTTTNRVAIATDLAITKTVGGGTLTPGATVAYTLTVTNNGPLPSDGAQVIDNLPAGTTFVSAAGCVSTGPSVQCSVGPLAVGASKAFTLTLQLSNPYADARPLLNTATVDAPGDTNPGNNTSQANSPVGADPGSTVGIPTLSEWGVLILGSLAAMLGAFFLRRRH